MRAIAGFIVTEAKRPLPETSSRPTINYLLGHRFSMLGLQAKIVNKAVLGRVIWVIREGLYPT
jgi:hypothetical protein